MVFGSSIKSLFFRVPFKANHAILSSVQDVCKIMQIRNAGRVVNLPKTGNGTQFRRRVVFPEDGKYTTEPLDVIRLAGRDPVSGRVVCKGIGGGMKYKYTWVDHSHLKSQDGNPIHERIMKVERNIMCRTASTALVASHDKKRWIIATENMKEGDIITTYNEIPRIPVRPKEGDSHPVGALPIATIICCVEPYPNFHAHFGRAAGSMIQIVRKIDDRVILQLPSKQEVSVDKWCMVRVGRISNKEHSSTPIGSAGWNRWLGNRPRSGLWKRKTGYHGRKIRPLPPIRIMNQKSSMKDLYCDITLPQ